MKAPLFKDGQALVLCHGFKYEGLVAPKHDTIYHVAANIFKGGAWYVQLVELGCLHAFSQEAFMKSRRSNLTVALLNNVAPETPF